MGVLGGAADLQCMCMCDCVDGCTNVLVDMHLFLCVYLCARLCVCCLPNLDWNLEKFADSQVLLSDTGLVKTHWLCSDVGFIFLLSCSLCVLFGLGTEHLEGQLGYFSSSLQYYQCFPDSYEWCRINGSIKVDMIRYRWSHMCNWGVAAYQRPWFIDTQAVFFISKDCPPVSRMIA